MTEQKAKEVLNNIWNFADAQDEEKGDVVDDAIIEVIGCMEEVEQYRALGTVEEIKKKIKTELPYMSLAQARFKSELDEYRNIGTVEELKEAREKQVASKWIECPYADLIMCPSCNAEFSTIDNCTEQFEYCPKCGKRLEWGEEDE